MSTADKSLALHRVQRPYCQNLEAFPKPYTGYNLRLLSIFSTYMYTFEKKYFFAWFCILKLPEMILLLTFTQPIKQ